MTLTSNIDGAGSPEGLRERAARAGRSLQEAAGELAAKAQQGLGSARERSGELTSRTGRRLRAAGRTAVGDFRRRPVPYAVAAVAGLAAVAVLSSPRARGLLVETAGRLWNAVQARKGSLKL